MATRKTRHRPSARRNAQSPQPRRGAPLRPSWLAWLAVAVIAAGVGLWLAKVQAQGPSKQVAPPATGLPDTPDYHSLLVAPSDLRHLLLGTHAGLYQSTDGGRSWSAAELSGKDAMNLVRVGGQTVWAAGHEVLTRSRDGGKTWSDVRPAGLPGLDVHGFAAAPNGSTLYAAIAGRGLYRSSDSGRRFALVSEEVGPGVFGLAVAPDGRILAADPRQGLLVSRDGGKTWRRALAVGVIGVAINPGNPKRILATGPGILLSADGGRTWKRVLALADGAGPVAWAPSDPSLAYAVGFDRKLYRTRDSGRSWQEIR